MKCYIVGIGMGNPKLLTIQASEIIEKSTCLIGAQRMLDCFQNSSAKKMAAPTPSKMKKALDTCDESDTVAILVSGDCGFYSAANGLSTLLESEQVEYHPGISSLQYFCARLNLAWDDTKVISLHGRENNLIHAVRNNKKTFVLTGGTCSVSNICKQLSEYDLESCIVHVGERLSYPDERIVSDTAQSLIAQEFASLSVMLIENPTVVPCQVTHGIPDESFIRGKVPMTKNEVRTVSMSKLHLKPGQIVWDIGAGTGSISVEIARILPQGTVYAIEYKTDALALIKENKRHFGISNLKIVEGSAPEILDQLPVPDAVFIGGSSGGFSKIVDCILHKNPCVRIVANAITLETVNAALNSFVSNGLTNQEAIQVSISKSKLVGGYHMMLANNPVYILSAGGKA